MNKWIVKNEWKKNGDKIFIDDKKLYFHLFLVDNVVLHSYTIFLCNSTRIYITFKTFHLPVYGVLHGFHLVMTPFMSR